MRKSMNVAAVGVGLSTLLLGGWGRLSRSSGISSIPESAAPGTSSPASAASKLVLDTLKGSVQNGAAYLTTEVYDDGAAQITEAVYKGNHTIILQLGCLAGQGVGATGGTIDKKTLSSQGATQFNALLGFIEWTNKGSGSICSGGTIDRHSAPLINNLVSQINISK